jgi:hypothetical protein
MASWAAAGSLAAICSAAVAEDLYNTKNFVTANPPHTPKSSGAP